MVFWPGYGFWFALALSRLLQSIGPQQFGEANGSCPCLGSSEGPGSGVLAFWGLSQGPLASANSKVWLETR